MSGSGAEALITPAMGPRTFSTTTTGSGHYGVWRYFGPGDFDRDLLFNNIGAQTNSQVALTSTTQATWIAMDTDHGEVWSFNVLQ